MSASKFDIRQSVLRTALPMIGNAVNESVDTVLSRVDSETSKLFEDRNILLVSDGTISLNAAGTSVIFSSNLRLHINSQVAGGSPTVIDLGSIARTLSVSGRMLYAVVNRTGGTAVVTSDSATLPAVTSANQEVVLIAKRVDATDGTKRVYFRNGFTLSAGETSRIGGGGTVYASEFSIVDPTDTTKKVIFDASGAATGTTTTLLALQTVNRQLSLPDVTSFLVARTSVDTLTNKTMGDALTFDEIATPSNPPALADKLYFKSDGNLYKLNSSGVEVQIDTVSSAPVGQSYELTNLGLSASVSGGNLTINLKQKDGTSNPTTGAGSTIISFRDVATNGQFIRRTVTGPVSITVLSSTGRNLGYLANTNQYIYVWAIDNGGTVVLGTSGSQIFDDNIVVNNLNSFANAVFFAQSGVAIITDSSTGALLNKAVRLIGRVLINEPSSTNWTVAPSDIQLMPFKSTPDFINQTSAVKTPSAGGGGSQYPQMVNGSVTLTPGIWELRGILAFENNGLPPAYNRAAGVWAVTPGTNSNVAPTLINASPNLVIQAGGTGTALYLDGISSDIADLPTFPTRLEVIQTTVIYLVPFPSITIDTARSRITVIIWAERIR